MQKIDCNKEIKKATVRVNFLKETTDIFFMVSAAMAVLCVGAEAAKSFGVGKNHLPLGSLAITNFITSLSFFFLASMSNVLKNEAIDERERLIRDLNKKKEDAKKLMHHHDSNNIVKAQSKEHC
ncbi:MAG: hypothetical protein J6Y03_05535 [Alphaproteobacteria bacterium]|nr:hypothetical protein [Alphaproteobacteria bacterium]